LFPTKGGHFEIMVLALYPQKNLEIGGGSGQKLCRGKGQKEGHSKCPSSNSEPCSHSGVTTGRGGPGFGVLETPIGKNVGNAHVRPLVFSAELSAVFTFCNCGRMKGVSLMVRVMVRVRVRFRVRVSAWGWGRD
jgi:hypothetical protein